MKKREVGEIILDYIYVGIFELGVLLASIIRLT